MRYRHPTARRAKLAQYFTPSRLAASLADCLEQTDSVLELGAGDGALVRATLQRFPHASITAVELDRSLIPQLKRIAKTSRIACANVLNASELQRRLGCTLFPTVIGNPPFGEGPSARANPNLKSQFPEVDRGGWIRQDLVFLWESWERLATGGTLAMIVASPIVCDPVFQRLRTHIAAHSGRLEIFQLHDDSQSVSDVFDGVEVHTFLLVAKKKRGLGKGKVLLHRATAEGERTATLAIARDAAASTRWDYQYHDMLSGLESRKNAPTLQQIGASISRGSRSHNDYELSGLSHVHTKDFDDGTTRMRLRCGLVDPAFKLAEPGDILVPRVGSRCLLRQALVMSGRAPHTEAVFRIRIAHRFRQRVLAALESPLGTLWRRMHARGSCARHITVGALLSLPVP